MSGLKMFPLNQFRHDHGPASLIWKYIWGPVNLFMSFAPLIILNVAQVIGLLIYPFSVVTYRKYQRGIALAIWGWWGFAAQNICGLKVVVTGDHLTTKENAIVICNHQGMSDIIVILCHAFNLGTVTRTTWMAKNVLRYVPGLGWGLAFLDTVFLKRNWARDEAGIKATFAKIIENNLPVWMVSFPEGTRISDEKKVRSREFARQRNQKPLEHLLIPRSMGFIASLAGMRGHISAVYSLTIGYPKRVPALHEIIRGDIDEVALHVRRIPVAEIPVDKSLAAQWLNEEFRIKDQLLEIFVRTGSFPEQREISVLPV